MQERKQIPALYGFRALLCLVVANYHIWQQGWLGQYVTLFGRVISFDYITRTGYMMVDGLILLSGFLLFLPHARSMVQGAPVPQIGRFYVKRISRIVPSYLLAVLGALFLFALPQHVYRSDQVLYKDLFSHLTFTQTFFFQPYQQTHLNGVLWTVCIEMQLYLLFPLLAGCMRRKMTLTAILMCFAGWIYRAVIYFRVPNTAMYINQMPAFLDVFALGMLGAYGVTLLEKRLNSAGRAERIAVMIAAVAAVILGVTGTLTVLRHQARISGDGIDALRLGQLSNRLPLALGLLTFILGLSFLPKPLEWIMSCRPVRFMARISFNFYIWHQILAVQMIDRWFGRDLVHYNPGLQKGYTLLCFLVAWLVATAVTLLVEEPCAKMLMKLYDRFFPKGGRKPAPAGEDKPETALE